MNIALPPDQKLNDVNLHLGSTDKSFANRGVA